MGPLISNSGPNLTSDFTREQHLAVYLNCSGELASKRSKSGLMNHEIIIKNEVQNHEFLFNSHKSESINIPFKATDTVESAIELTVVVAGDMMGPSINFYNGALCVFYLFEFVTEK